MERRAAEAEARVASLENARLDAEADARAAAAEWLRGRERSIRRQALRDARRETEAAGGETAPAAGPEERLGEQAQRRSETGKPLSLNEATFEQLRGTGMSVTQATRVIAYRERVSGFDSVEELGSVPGFQESQLSELKERLTAP
jgi:competence ComEA-like helix-hairpin-helix protein